jgi:hypothetical protein
MSSNFFSYVYYLYMLHSRKYTQIWKLHLQVLCMIDYITDYEKYKMHFRANHNFLCSSWQHTIIKERQFWNPWEQIKIWSHRSAIMNTICLQCSQDLRLWVEPLHRPRFLYVQITAVVSPKLHKITIHCSSLKNCIFSKFTNK